MCVTLMWLAAFSSVTLYDVVIAKKKESLYSLLNVVICYCSVNS